MKIRVFLDGASEPIAILDPPEKFRLDTTKLKDGAHHLQFQATDENGKTGIQDMPFEVHNGPAIAIHGMHENEIVHDQITMLVNAYSSQAGDDFEPMRIETPRPVPTWAWLNLLFVFAWGMWYLGVEYRDHQADLIARGVQTSSQQSADTGDWRVLGEQVFGNNCAACHAASGEGLTGVFPPLKGNAVVSAADPSDHIRTLVNGVQGKTIDGVHYSSPMPAFGGLLSHEQIAAVINHERTSWGNNAPTVAADQVTQIASGSELAPQQPADPPAETPPEPAIESAAVVAQAAPAASGAQDAGDWNWQDLGAQVYGAHCAACHQANGAGLPAVFPPLAGDAVVTADDPAEHIQTILIGLSGKTIDGTAYVSPMTPFAALLSDEQVAAVVNHERSNWGNSATLVTPDQIKQYR